MTQSNNPIDESGWPKTAATLPILDALHEVCDLTHALYDSLERLAREARSGNVSAEALQDADQVMAKARRENN